MRGSTRAPRAVAIGVVAVLSCSVTAGLEARPRTQAPQPIQAAHPGEPAYAAADVEAGFRLYSATCVACHGPDGDAVGTVNLKAGRFRRVSSDVELMALISNGIPGTGMPAHRLAPSELAALVAYVRSMRAFDGRFVALGDAGRGKAVFEGKGGCTTCHRVNGIGSRVAPDVSEIGTMRAASNLQRSLLDPSSGMLPINRPVRVATREGQVITGRRLNEDTFTIQLIDGDGRLLSLDKSDIRDLQIQTRSSMPSFRDTLSSEELADVLAYLVSLKR